MSRSYDNFKFKHFEVAQQVNAMKIGTDGVLLGAWVDTDGVGSALDIGTGTGLIALMLAQRGVREIVGVELDADSADEARRNVANSPWPDAIEVETADFLRFATTKRFDLIVSNPPFFAEDLTSPDPRRAAARSQASLPLEALVNHAATMLTAGGKLALILPYSVAQDLQLIATMNRLHIVRRCEVRHSPKSQEIRRVMVEMSTLPHTLSTQSLVIQSPEYQSLTKDFYL